MKNQKRKNVIRKSICALLTAAMLCSDAGAAVYAAEPEKQDVLTKITEENSESGETSKYWGGGNN